MFADYCSSPRFLTCERYRAYLEHLRAVYEKDDLSIVEYPRVSRAIQLDRARRIMRNLSPKPEYQSEVEHFTNLLLLDQFQSVYRENYITDIAFQTEKLDDGSDAVRTEVEWKYEVHNISSSRVRFYIPFDIKTYDFREQGLDLTEHVEIEQLDASIAETDNWVELKKHFGLDKVPIVAAPPMKARLDLSKKAFYEIPAKNFIKVRLLFNYLNRAFDNHTQRMTNLTRNFTLQLHYSDNEFYVDVNDFCLPKKEEKQAGYLYEWYGWFLPHHGVSVDFDPINLHKISLLEDETKAMQNGR